MKRPPASREGGLVGSERDGGVDMHRAPGRDPACEGGDEKKQDGASHKSRSFRRRCSEEECAQPSRVDEGSARAEEKPGPGKPHAMAENHAQDLRASRAQSEADADLMPTSAHLKAEQTIESDGREQNREECETGEKK